MVGDVNIFLTDPTDLSLAELEVMIAGEATVFLHTYPYLDTFPFSDSILVCNRAELQRPGHREGGDTHDDVLR